MEVHEDRVAWIFPADLYLKAQSWKQGRRTCGREKVENRGVANLF